MRKRLKDEEAEILGIEIKPKDSDGKNHRYPINNNQWSIIESRRASNVDTLKDGMNFEGNPTELSESKGGNGNLDNTLRVSAFNDKGEFMNVDEFCKYYGLPKEKIHSYKLITNVRPTSWNIFFKEPLIEEEIKEFDIDSIVKKHIKPIILPKSNFKKKATFDRLVYTDTHIGMTPNENGYSLYGGKWDEEELNKKLNKIVKKVLKHQTSNELYIDDLGDLMDGWDGETVRKGHKLPQNMDNEKAFDVALDFKVRMVDILINYYDKITLHSVTNDNHSGSFSYTVNKAAKSILELKYSNVKCEIQRRFIDHYTVGKHAFVLSHGKDSKSLKFGFKIFLDSKQAEKIDQYLKKYNVFRQAEYIEFSKGDSHQLLFDMCTSDDFDYFNYGALSPSSEWVQTNFKKGRSSVTFFNIEYDDNDKSIHNIFFK